MIATYTFAIGLRRRSDSRAGGGELLGWPQGTITTVVAGILQVFDIDGFTLRNVTGVWKGVEEPSIEVVTSADLTDADVLQLARMFAIQFDQESIGIHKSNPYTFVSA